MENSNFVNSFMNDLMEQQKLQQQLVSNNNYFKWLESFVAHNNGRFSDDELQYCPEKIRDTDKKFVKKLSLFFRAIFDYAEKNGIVYEVAYSGVSLLVDFNNKRYCFGVIYGPGSCCFCNQVDNIEKTKNVINFNDVIKSRKEKQIEM